MSNTGPKIETPLQMLKHVYEELQKDNEKRAKEVEKYEQLGTEEKSKVKGLPKKPASILDRAKERPKRLFSDILKEFDRPAHDHEFFKGEGFKEFRRIILEHKMPVTESFISDTKKLFAQLDKALAEDPGWNAFWEQVKLKDQLTDEEVNYLRDQALVSYRFKLMSNAQMTILADTTLDQKTKDSAKEVLSLVQIYNGNYQEHKDKVAEKTEEGFKNKSAIRYVQAINVAIDQGIAMLKEGKPTEEVRKAMENRREEIFTENKNTDDYATYYGEKGAKGVFDEYFTLDKMMEKITQYQAVCQEVGFDVNERVKALTKIKETQGPWIGDSNVKQAEDLALLTKRLAHFSEMRLTSNSQINEIPSLKDYKEKLGEVNNKLQDGLVGAAQRGDREAMALYAKAGISSDRKLDDYKRGFFSALKDGFRDFPKGFPASLKDIFVKPPRTITQIAQMYGDQETVKQLINNKSIMTTPVDNSQEMIKTLQSTMGESVQPSVSPTVELRSSKAPLKGFFSKLREKSKKEKQPEPTVDPIQVQIQAIENRLQEMKTKENYQLPEAHPYKIAMDKEEKLLTQVRDELRKDPINQEAVNKLIDDGRKEMSEDAKVDRGRDLPVETMTLLENVQDAIEPPRSTVGVKSSGGK